jgi:two-component system, NtrC family, response regulator AtoC
MASGSRNTDPGKQHRGSTSSPGGFRLRGLVEGEERVFDLDAGEHLVGRSPESDLQLPTAGVSRRHAVLRVNGSGLTVEDRGSTNGTFVDERQVEVRSKARPGAVLGFGPVALHVQSLQGDESRLAIELARRPQENLPAGLLQSTVHLNLAGADTCRSERTTSGLTFPAGYQPARSTAMTALYRRLKAVLKGPISVLLCGETGVGKEMIARILHLSSPRRESPFLAVNCSAIPADLLEAELFGIGKAVATGVDPRPGLFLSAAGGTLLLDEVGEMAPALQAKLLRVLQEKEVRPVGGSPRRVDVRIVSATNADLTQLMDAGRFREDLYYRLAGDVLELPPLRDCRDDIPALAKRFLEKYSRETDIRPRGLSIEALRLLCACTWPGNVRELENEIRRLVYRSSEDQIIDSSMLSEAIRARTGAPGSSHERERPEPQSFALAARVRAFEIEGITGALQRCEGNQTRAAELLGMSRNGLLKKMKRLGIRVSK